MIIDLPLVPDLALGTDRNIPQVGDNQVFLPASIQPIVGIITPHTVAAPSTTNQPQSCTHQSLASRTNQAATLTTTIFILPPGLFTFSVFASMRSNYTLIGSGTPDVRIHVIEAGLSLYNLLSLWATVGANITQQTHNRLLMRSQSIVELFINSNGVGQTIDVGVAINVQREL